MKTSENRDPLRGRFPSQRLSVLLPLFICPSNSLQKILVTQGKSLGVPKPGCFKPGCLQFFCGNALLRSFAPFCALLRSFVDLRLRSFAHICVFLRPTAFRTTAFGNFRKQVKLSSKFSVCPFGRCLLGASNGIRTKRFPELSDGCLLCGCPSETPPKWEGRKVPTKCLFEQETPKLGTQKCSTKRGVREPLHVEFALNAL